MAKISINIVTGSLQKDDIIVGIDLGTTNSLIAAIHPDTQQPIILKEFDATSIVPSVIYFDEKGHVLVGDAAKPFLEVCPERTISSVKRLMGKSYNDIQHENKYFTYTIINDDADKLVKVAIGDAYYSPIELSSYILRELKNRAEHILKMPVTKCVITVPAYFNDTQRQATRDAGKLAGLDVLRIINEPTAASLAYGIGLDDTVSKCIAVYDLGGGTFDISILKIANGIFEVLSTNGDTYLGGDDIDNLLLNFCLQQSGSSIEAIQTNKNLLQQYKSLAETAKIHLSTHNEYMGEINGKPIVIGIDDFNALIQPIIDKSLTCCQQALADAQIDIKAIDAVIMVGGSTKIPAIQKAVSLFFDKQVNDSLNPHEVVALGAAIQADVLSGNNKDILLLDITPLSLGVETMGGLMDVLIPRNTKIPFGAGRQYTTQKDGQTGMQIAVYQGERDLVKDNRKLAEFELKGIPPMPAGLPKVDIAFKINADGILHVVAKELRSGVEQSIEVKPQYGLSDGDVEKMLSDSLQYAQQDVIDRALIEAKTEAEQMINMTENFIQKNAVHLSEIEIADTNVAMDEIELAIQANDKNKIQKSIETLNTITRPFAERIMDIAVSSALKGNKL